MKSNKVHVELLVGRRVRDMNDRVVGKIRAIRARRSGHDYLVEEYHLGPVALLEVLGISTVRMLGVPWPRKPTSISWDKLDLSDPERPRFLGRKEDLRKS